MNYYLSSYLLSKINLLFFSLNPNFLGVAMTRTKNSYIFVTYVPCWFFFYGKDTRIFSKVRHYLYLQCVVLLTKNQTCFTGYNLKSYELYEISSCSKCLHRSNGYNTHRSVIKMVYFLLQQLCEYTNKMVQSCSQINILT